MEVGTAVYVVTGHLHWAAYVGRTGTVVRMRTDAGRGVTQCAVRFEDVDPADTRWIDESDLIPV